MIATITSLEARCKVCGDTGSKDQDIDGFLNCTACDAAERRMEMQNYISSLSPNMSNWAKCWAAYNFGMHRPAVAQPSEAAQPGELQSLLTVFDMGLGFALCHRDFSETRNAIKKLQQDFTEIRIAISAAPTAAVSAAPSGDNLVAEVVDNGGKRFCMLMDWDALPVGTKVYLGATPSGEVELDTALNALLNHVIDDFREMNPSNYTHDEACDLNNWGVEAVGLAQAVQDAITATKEPK